MSNERSPRASCWTTIGTRGMGRSPRGSYCNPAVARGAHASVRRNPSVALRSPMTAVRREIVLPVDRERAWELLTEPAELREWLADEVELAPKPGAPVRAAWPDTGEAREGVVEEVEEARRLAFRWDDGAGVPSRVEWTLDDAPGGTRFVVTERPLVALPVTPATATPTASAAAWTARTTALARAATLVLA